MDDVIQSILLELEEVIAKTREASSQHQGASLFPAQIAMQRGDFSSLYRIAYTDGFLCGASEAFEATMKSIVAKIQSAA